MRNKVSCAVAFLMVVLLVNVSLAAQVFPLHKDLMKTSVKYPPRKQQSEVYAGPITLPQYERFQFLRDQLEKGGFTLTLPKGN
jgi:hypothetical protein